MFETRALFGGTVKARRRQHRIRFGIVALIVFALSAVLVAVAFIWAAKKDGEEDRAVQARTGIRRLTRLGR